MIRKNIKETIKEYFFQNPTTKTRVRQLERTLKLSLPSVIRYCEELEKEGILQSIHMANVAFYAADRANPIFLLEKRLFNLREIHASGIIDYLRNKMNNPLMIVFGSYAKGEDTELSDIDLFVAAHSKKEMGLSQFEKTLKRKIQLLCYKSLKDISNGHLANNIINGYILNGFIEVFK